MFVLVLKLQMEKACHITPSKIRCDDEIPEVRRRLKTKFQNSQSNNNKEDVQPVYSPNLGVRTCDPCPPVPHESVSAASDTLNCHYEDDGEEQHEENRSQSLEINGNIDQNRRPKRKIQFETKCREFTPSCGGTDSVNFQVG